MTENKKNKNSIPALVNSIVAGIQEKKGKNITLLDLSAIEDSICKYMVIAEGNTPTQVEAISESVREIVWANEHEKVSYSHQGNGEWIALDYINVMVHLFVPALRNYYDLETLWADANRYDFPTEE